MIKYLWYSLIAFVVTFFFAILITYFNVSYQESKVKENEIVDNRMLIKNTPVEYAIQEIDSCEYLVFFCTYHSISAIHKVNCKNKIHSK